jgi:glycerol kinase
VNGFLVIDQSTSATKAVLIDSQGRVLDKSSRDHQQFYPQPGWVEHDAEEIWRNTLAVASELLQRQAGDVGHLAAVGITNQRETVVVFDRETGKPLHPAIVWQCRRGDALCDAQKQQGREPAVRARTGLRIDGYFSASKLQWLMREQPGLAEQIRVGKALIGTIDTYLIYRLTGGAVFATDHTNASRTLLYDIRTLRWDPEFCQWWQVPIQALAEVRASADQFGETTFGGLLSRPVPIRGVMGDSQASLFAQRCLETGMAKVTFGTGSSVLLNVGHRVPGALQGAVATLAWVYAGQPTYALEGIINSSAATLNWLRDQLGIISSAEQAEALARAVEPDQAVYLVPAFSGMGVPYWCSTARAAVVGLSAHSDRRHVARAALESMAYQLRDVLAMMHAETGIELRHIQADGGPSSSEFLMQFTADIIGVELRVAQYPDCSARGAAMMGALGLGLHGSIQALANLRCDERNYRRQMTMEQAQSRYAGWQRAVQQVLCAA